MFFKEQSGNQFDITFLTQQAFTSAWFLLSRCRVLSQQERMRRLTGMYDSVPKIDAQFKNLVLKRLSPAERES